MEKAIIPPKGIKRNFNIEGSEIFEGISDDEDVDSVTDDEGEENIELTEINAENAIIPGGIALELLGYG